MTPSPADLWMLVLIVALAAGASDPEKESDLMDREPTNNTRVWVPAIEKRPEEPNAYYADHLSLWHEAPKLACEHVQFLEEEVGRWFEDSERIPVNVERYNRIEVVEVTPSWIRTYTSVARENPYGTGIYEDAHYLIGNPLQKDTDDA
ncbi:hypothetical protein [Deinococcus cellulosilyticus]|uniref:Uncharacterized protein n=1 Tax=Deinococcus cellulosilyticus (strain DSM 18568 / NBRC 106333 / KACC 11606 / 5516J-15) TaxID=1223518 RepID=A0A511MZ32_DEIC1|nr:hypothetical protein [Deinococcus cellulosilyticus]GEM45880.1 hypothetical protein DC3_15150 [Deinococcus cellulosilyticus NBRC 106333 = KACC 11606]